VAAAGAACKDEAKEQEVAEEGAAEHGGDNQAQKQEPKPEPGADEPNPLGALAEAGEAMEQAAKAMGQAGAGVQGTGKVVNWRKLEPFLPDELGDFQAKSDLKGSTTTLGEMQVSKVERRYAAGERQARIEIVDTAKVPMLRAGFAMAQHVNEDSTEGVKKGMKIEGEPALLNWRKSNKRGKIDVLAAGRFLVTIQLVPAETPERAVELAKTIDIEELAKLKPELQR
jgi:hypothetical protein